MTKENEFVYVFIGFGSIAKKHKKILTNHFKIKNIIIFKNKKSFKIKILNKAKKYKFLICSHSDSHLYYFSKLKNFSGSYFFIEKPISINYEEIKNNQLLFKNSKNVMIGYVFRYSLIISEFKKLLLRTKNTPVIVEINCYSYLPFWRKNVDYKKSITAIVSKGGGIQNELSHEIDYMVYFFGMPKAVFAIQNNSKRLNINTSETMTIIFEFKNNFNININLSINSKTEERICRVIYPNMVLKLDLLNMNITKYSKTFKSKNIFQSSENLIQKYIDQMNIFINFKKNSKLIKNNLNDAILVSKLIKKINTSIIKQAKISI